MNYMHASCGTSTSQNWDTLHCIFHSFFQNWIKYEGKRQHTNIIQNSIWPAIMIPNSFGICERYEILLKKKEVSINLQQETDCGSCSPTISTKQECFINEKPSSKCIRYLFLDQPSLPFLRTISWMCNKKLVADYSQNPHWCLHAAYNGPSMRLIFMEQ